MKMKNTKEMVAAVQQSATISKSIVNRKSIVDKKSIVNDKAISDTIVAPYDVLPNRQLTRHFNLREFLVSATAIRHGIDNTPSEAVVQRLTALCQNVLEPLRRRFGVIRINSGYRCEAVNKLVGGARTSQHLTGEAADINTCNPEVAAKMFTFISSHLVFDQLIMEHNRKTSARWIHVSYRNDGHNRRQVLSIVK